jgi:hypothetical protein
MKIKHHNIITNLFISSMAILITIGAIELSVRLFVYQKETDNPFSNYNRPNYYHPSPFTMFQGKPNSPTGFIDKLDSTPIYFNKLGYRGELPNAKKANNEFRIFILGGSTVFGSDVDIASSMHKYFSENGYSNVMVFNFGAVSSNNAQELARIVFDISDYDPDLIIMYGGANDFEHPFYADPRPGYPFNFFITEANPYLKRDLDDYPTLPLMLYGSAFMRHFFSNYFIKRLTKQDELRESADYKSNKWFEQIAQSYWSSLEKAAVISQAFGSDFIGVLQPLVYYKTNLHEQEKFFVNPESLRDFSILRQMVLDRSEKTSTFTFYDKSELFNSFTQQVFLDTCHIDDNYNDFLATALAELVKNQKSFQTYLVNQKQTE